MKDNFFSAYRHFKERERDRGALLAKERIYWALEAIRANDTLDKEKFVEACKAAPQLQHESFAGSLPVTRRHLELIRCILREGL